MMNTILPKKPKNNQVNKKYISTREAAAAAVSATPLTLSQAISFAVSVALMFLTSRARPLAVFMEEINNILQLLLLK